MWRWGPVVCVETSLTSRKCDWLGVTLCCFSLPFIFFQWLSSLLPVLPVLSTWGRPKHKAEAGSTVTLRCEIQTWVANICGSLWVAIKTTLISVFFESQVIVTIFIFISFSNTGLECVLWIYLCRFCIKSGGGHFSSVSVAHRERWIVSCFSCFCCWIRDLQHCHHQSFWPRRFLKGCQWNGWSIEEPTSSTNTTRLMKLSVQVINIVTIWEWSWSIPVASHLLRGINIVTFFPLPLAPIKGVLLKSSWVGTSWQERRLQLKSWTRRI